MSVAELKRCFECGATYPQEVLACANDGTPLCFDTVGRRWKIEEFLGRRPGGAVFAGFQLVTGQRALIDLLSGENARDATALTRYQQELQALRLLDQNKGILKLIEEGTERDGSRFLVTELNGLRLLPELMIERRQAWLRPSGALLEPSEAAHLIRPLLSLLSTGARLGMAHGSLDMSQIYVGSESDFASGLGMLAHVKMHGLAALGMGPQLREAQAADLRGLALVLYELCTGKPPPAGELVVKEPLPETLSGPVGQVVLRALGAVGPAAYATAEEMQRALSSAAPSGFNAPISIPPAAASVPPPPSQPAMQSYRSLPPAPSVPGIGELGVGAVGTTLPPVRLTTQHPSVPTPMAPVAGLPQRSGLTSELRQVSILDLMREMQEMQAQQESAAREETLARSRSRPSSKEIKVYVPSEGAADSLGLPPAEPGAAPAGQPASAGRLPSGESLEPTLDARQLPLRPDSASSARVTVRGPDAPGALLASAAPSAISGHAPITAPPTIATVIRKLMLSVKVRSAIHPFLSVGRPPSRIETTDTAITGAEVSLTPAKYIASAPAASTPDRAKTPCCRHQGRAGFVTEGGCVLHAPSSHAAPDELSADGRGAGAMPMSANAATTAASAVPS